MKGDFTRSTFDPSKHFTRVLTQQGRVQLDADGNEQVAILWHYLRTLATDVIGPHGGPNARPGFEISPDVVGGRVTDLKIGAGRYYVDGLLCENEGDQEVTYFGQPGYPLDGDALPDPPFLVYLDVWERHVTAVEEPGIREDALGGPDTATRAQVVWQVKTTDEKPAGFDLTDVTKAKEQVESVWDSWVESWQPANRGVLKAKAREVLDGDTGPCTIPPEARYRGVENRLYRVEIHRGGEASTATFKWSRDNGCVTFPVREVEGDVASLEHLGRDGRAGLEAGDWVEIEDSDYALGGRAEPLRRVTAVDPIDLRVTLSGGHDTSERPLLLRRWDHGDAHDGESESGYGDLTLPEGDWLDLEDGVQIFFEPAPAGGKPNVYRTGDYWLIPARTATGDVEWPRVADEPVARPPHGVEHHYAPLAMVVPNAPNSVVDCRSGFDPLRE